MNENFNNLNQLKNEKTPDFEQKERMIKEIKKRLYGSGAELMVKYHNKIVDFSEELGSKYGLEELQQYYAHHLMIGSSMSREHLGKDCRQLIDEGVVKDFDFPDKGFRVEDFMIKLDQELEKDLSVGQARKRAGDSKKDS